jgi:hypothetical protein
VEELAPEKLPKLSEISNRDLEEASLLRPSVGVIVFDFRWQVAGAPPDTARVSRIRDNLRVWRPCVIHTKIQYVNWLAEALCPIPRR